MKPSEEPILQAIFEYRGMTAEQVTRLLYSNGSLTSVRQKLMLLTPHEDEKTKKMTPDYLVRFQNPSPTGASPWVYSLGRTGLRHLEFKGIETENFTPLKENGRERKFYYFLNHLLGVNDFLIAASLLPQLNNNVTLLRVDPEWRIRTNPFGIVIPDSFLDFKTQVGTQAYQVPVFLEFDNGSEFGKNFKNKLRDIVDMVVSGSYQERFSIDRVTIAFATPENESRRELMRRHMYSVLEEKDALPFAEWFLFACMKYEVKISERNRMKWLSSERTFLDPIWYSPISNDPIPLLDLSE